MPEEIGLTIQNLNNITEIEYGDLKIFSGDWFDNDQKESSIYLSVAWSGWGKVSAARAATRLLSNCFRDSLIDLLLFTGVAGAAKSDLNQWDIVIPDELIQYDMDARPLFNQYVIPALNQEKLTSNIRLVNWARSTLQESIVNGSLNIFGCIDNGLIATGDRFISEKVFIDNLNKELPGLSAVEMEGAAVAQVASQEKVPWLIVRVISDCADKSASQTFNDFLKEYKKLSWDLIHELLKNFHKCPLIHQKYKR
tara:strand:- start:12160 stop:12918 length:759 start_codon:yes stop_codon:yes gene_type:complete